jgi:regulator of replication initiation timing
MDNPNEIATKIAEYQEQIENLLREVEKLKRRVTELMCLAIYNSEGDVTSYADWQ